MSCGSFLGASGTIIVKSPSYDAAKFLIFKAEKDIELDVDLYDLALVKVDYSTKTLREWIAEIIKNPLRFQVYPNIYYTKS